MKHGQGTYRFKNGQEKRGLWYDDILTENSLSGSGSNGIIRGISMKSVLSEQNEKEQKESNNYRSNQDIDDNDSVISNLSKSYREVFQETSLSSIHKNKGIRNTTSITSSPNRNRSSSDSSERSVVNISRQSPLRNNTNSNHKQLSNHRYSSPKLS